MEKLEKEFPLEFDHYAILNIPRDATTEQIALAYRKLALQYHPEKDPEFKNAFNPPEGLNEYSHLPSLPDCAKWLYVNRAFDILSNALRREVYDKYGEFGLINGCPLPAGYFPPYSYDGNCMKTFHDVFNTYSPYANLIDAVSTPPLLHANEFGNIALKIKDKPVEKIIFLDIKEIYFGTVKRMKILRNEYVEGDETKIEKREKILKVVIPPGQPSGSFIVFKEEGDQYISKIPGDIIFITADIPNNKFRRDGNNLHMNYPIDLRQAFCGFKLTIHTIDDRKLTMLISDLIGPGAIKHIKNEGLPRFGEKNSKGDLYVHFIITFPRSLSRDLQKSFSKWFDELKCYEYETKNCKSNRECGSIC